MKRKPDINVVCNSTVAIPTLHKLFEDGRLQSIGLPENFFDAGNKVFRLASQLSIPLQLLTQNGLKGQLETWLAEYPCRLVLCITFPHKIPASLLMIPQLGFINVHFGLLPEYRGAETVFWQIKNREPFGGITVHQMDEHWDAGAIFFSRKIPIHPEETHGKHLSKLAEESAWMIPDLMKVIDSEQTMPVYAQNSGKYYPKPVYQDVRLLWLSESSADLLATIKACNPWNKGAFTLLNGKELQIVEARRLDSFHGITSGFPGSILISPDCTSFAICCQDERFLMPEILYSDEGFITPLALLKMGLNQTCHFQ